MSKCNTNMAGKCDPLSDVLSREMDSGCERRKAQDWAEESRQDAAAAAGSALAAKTSENAAADSARAAAESENAAADSASAAETSKTAAADSAKAAADSADAAQTSAAVAAASKQDAAASASTAAAGAAKAEISAAAAAEQAQTACQYAEAAKGSADAAAEHAARTGRDVQAAQGSAQEAAGAAAAAGTSETNAAKYAKQAQSYAVGGTGTRADEDTDNAAHYYEQAKRISQGLQGALMPMGTISFARLAGTAKEPGYLYNISDAFETDERFKEGPGHKYPAGTNVYYTADEHWDAMSGAYVLGVKGNAEQEYRLGQVNITKENIGLGNVPNVATDDQTPAFTQAAERANLTNGDKLSVLFGKIAKWFSDLKKVAFSGSYNDLTDKPTIPTVPGEATEGSAGLLSPEDKKKIDSIGEKQDKLVGTAGQVVGFDVNGASQAVELGGTNLIARDFLGSSAVAFDDTNSRSKIGYKTNVGDYVSPTGHYKVLSTAKLPFLHKDVTYTVSALVWTAGDNVTFYMDFYPTDDLPESQKFIATSAPKRFTFTARSDLEEMDQSPSLRFVAIGLDSITESNRLFITDIKLEYGSVATDWSPAPEDLQDNIIGTTGQAVGFGADGNAAGVDVGGQNLYTGTQNWSGDWTYAFLWTKEPEKYRGLDVISRAENHSQIGKKIELEPGVYTLSYYSKADVEKQEGTTGVTWYMDGGNGNTTPEEILSIEGMTSDGSSAGQWGHVFFSTIWTKHKVVFRMGKQGVFWFCIAPGDVVSILKKIYVCGMKLERGSVATDWSPAPEDLQEKLALPLSPAQGGTGADNMFKINIVDLADPTRNQFSMNFYRIGEIESDYDFEHVLMQLNTNLNTYDAPKLTIYSQQKGQPNQVGQVIYSTTNKPSPSEIGALPSNGKALTAGTADKVAHALTFTGAVNDTFDGSAAKTISIPEPGGIKIHSAVFTAANWKGDDNSGYTQTVNVAGVTAATELGPPLMRPTGVRDTDEELHEALTIINEGFCEPGSGTVKVTVWEKPETDITVYWRS